MEKCIFCNKEKTLKMVGLLVCKTCLAKFVAMSLEDMEEFAKNHELSKEQEKFLGING